MKKALSFVLSGILLVAALTVFAPAALLRRQDQRALGLNDGPQTGRKVALIIGNGAASRASTTPTPSVQVEDKIKPPNRKVRKQIACFSPKKAQTEMTVKHSHLTEALTTMAGMIGKLSQGQEELQAAQKRTEERVNLLAGKPGDTNERLNVFIDALGRLVNQRNGNG
jgi:hypothetical protein